MISELLTFIYDYSTTLILGLLLLLLSKWLFDQFDSRYPTGPMGLPVVGYLPFVGTDPSFKFVELTKKYGNVYSVTLGSKKVVIVNKWEAIKAVLSSDNFLAKPHDDVFSDFFDMKSLLSESGPLWRENRRFSLQQFRDLGFGKSQMEARITEEIAAICEVIASASHGGQKPVEVRALLQSSTSNNIYSLIFGKRLELSDPIRVWMTANFLKTSQILSFAAILVFFPKALNLFAKLGLFRVGELKTIVRTVKKYLSDEIDNHVANFNRNDIRDYIDGYFAEMEESRNRNDKEDNNSDEKGDYFTKKMLLGNATAFFGAGSTTVQATLEWALLTMAEHQNVQKRVQEEIDRVIGRERQPIFPDKKLMPYTTAVIHEIMRWKPVIFLNLPRRALVDTVVEGVKIPADAEVICNFYSVHHDPEIWPDPGEFNPDRFLTPDGSLVKKEQFIPFSSGKRSCPGETLANVEIFLYFTSLLQKFRVLPSREDEPVNFAHKISIGSDPVGPVEFRFVKRV